MHGFIYAIYFLISGLFTLIFSMSFWWRDVISEATYLGSHTLAVQRGLHTGVGLFIVSEGLFFLAIFWGHFHCSLSPVPELAAHWPPTGIESVNVYELPLLNTVILLSSGITITYAHHSFIWGNRYVVLYGILLSILLAAVFTILQGLEYSVSAFTLSDGIYGSVFYFSTGFHGLHVIIGTAFIAVGLWRVLAYHLTDHHHTGLESSILYWHFVDIVWIILFFSVYCLSV